LGNACSFAQCGVERWDVKTLSDADTINVNFGNILESTVLEQCKLSEPEKIQKNLQRQSSETSVFAINCYVIGFKREEDMDIHIVIRDLDSNITMVAEYPSAHCPEVRATSRYDRFLKLNEWFLANIGSPTSRFKTLRSPVKVRLTGVGFFDRKHGQKGLAPNGREIHPVLGMQLLKD
jgi:hypothetical protein